MLDHTTPHHADAMQTRQVSTGSFTTHELNCERKFARSSVNNKLYNINNNNNNNNNYYYYYYCYATPV